MNDETEVLYNAACPVCRREIEHYEKLSTRAALPIRYDDLGDAALLARWGIEAEAAAERLHVRKGGQTYAGIPAFLVLWREIPQTRWLARIVALPGVHWIACKVYDYILAPLLFRWHQARQRRTVQPD
jgi:predicted DCC family thiol-disulfide oxidoreductase YuxK